MISVFTVSCAIPQPKKTLDVTPYLSQEERAVVNNVIFETQRVLNTLGNLKESNALDYVVKLDLPGWNVEKREQKVFVFTERKLIAYKDFSLPPTCIKQIDAAEVNVCHMKISQTLKKLAEAYGCKVKTYSTNVDGLKERVEVICGY